MTKETSNGNNVRPIIKDVLASRYASTAMLNIWSEEGKIVLEREFWIAVMKAQSECGIKISSEEISDYEACKTNVDLESIRQIELKTRHDVNARIEEFNNLAGHQLIHRGMTSRDLTENVELAQADRAMKLIRFKVHCVCFRLAEKAAKYSDLAMAGRSHNVPAQVTTLGKRFANCFEELSYVSEIMEKRTIYRGIKGPMGTQQDMLNLLGSKANVDKFEKAVLSFLSGEESPEISSCVGQVYPRSLDFEQIATLVQLGAVASNFATTLRLMAGNELVTEGFKEGQVGSSAMPHKMNARSSERMCGFYNLLRGYLTMIEGPAGNQWNEGDVSCSVVRRVAIQSSFLAADGLLDTWMTVLDEFGAYPAMIARELERYLPFLATTKILAAAVDAGMEREKAYACIKKHATNAALEMRNSGQDKNILCVSLGADEAFPLDEISVRNVMGEPIEFIGLASEQTKELISEIQANILDYPEHVNYKPEKIL